MCRLSTPYEPHVEMTLPDWFVQMDAVKKYPNAPFAYTANTYDSCRLDGEIPA